ncbi:hypothetical protein OMP38_19585 [Cohnella ginsengisoli]|uniref:Uncharacterized protein n=1 Tax=Cohnella ginsengisoli TaxID=425004 RepID=A0A9X4KIF4_9BACL|nr:hypothetical protein [Cohnella ginsengisoli]
MNKSPSTASEIGTEYQTAANPAAMSTSRICSVPYATDDRASDDSTASALNFPSFAPSISALFMGRPISNRFTLLTMGLSPLLFRRRSGA